VMPENARQRAAEIFGSSRKPDWITFTSSSTAKNFVLAAASIPLKKVRVASIGPVTSAAARNLGLTVAVEANPYTIDGLVAAILSAAKPEGQGREP